MTIKHRHSTRWVERLVVCSVMEHVVICSVMERGVVCSVMEHVVICSVASIDHNNTTRHLPAKIDHFRANSAMH
jgi:hypothetical protein